MRVAVIDIGSHSVLLLIGERADGGWQVSLDTARITRLGEGFSQGRTLQPQAIQRTLETLSEYFTICRVQGVARVIAVATAVVREAQNREVFLHQVRALSPATAECSVLSESDEARYSFLSATLDPERSVGEESLAVLDIGGGSVEVAFGHREVEHWFSFPVGAGRVRETAMPSDPPSPREVLRATRHLDEAFAPLRTLPQPDRVVAVGGTGVNLAMLALGRTQFAPAAAHGVWFDDETPAALLERLLRLSDAERRALPGIEPDRAPLLHIGALILERALFALRRETVQISARGLRYGILWSL
ncbi:MAG: hypothetical protein KatS3mg017_0666 [Fimbriimonadales bacterium]|nr:MAG: hypothetical protein KatS3mg017_0666 [Fimbriimonadales bacterium]